MTVGFRSLQARLAARLAVAFLVATALVVGIILYQGSEAADELSNDQLLVRAADLARLVHLDSTGIARLDLTPKLSQVYRPSPATELFLVKDDKGHVIAASPRDFANESGETALSANAPTFFRLERFGPDNEDYYGLRLRLESAAGPLVVTVARASDADALAYALLRAFVRQIAWIIPLFAAAMLTIAVLSIRRALRPILAISEQAANISPVTTGVRLSGAHLPSEIEPLVNAVNRALDRLEEGFAIQRQFTANAAHELRTPLAILTAGLESLEEVNGLDKLRNDVARMNRLVDQLLRVARLDAVPLNVRETIDLGAIVAEVVEYLAPWAVSQGRDVGFEGPAGVVWVRGNADALADAVRNLIENAVSHTPDGTEVVVRVTPDGAISVTDRGPGVAVEDRPHVFDRFWRGRVERSPGAGLGLAIVAEVARAHDGTVEIGGATGGGASFVLRVPVERVSRDRIHGPEKEAVTESAIRLELGT